ncbi:MAG: glucose-1-phosphate adenylyltransferase [Candidatus Scalindua sp. AMX11]|nr:MAG: glucose-1-phosphate adenylyltransferase [Candidatus Scalindua sp.]NOG82372.1 glucose-1-phosphate adenylyltransferase [Planctomycetota bacterium]RZV70597.1 MAG: glucose-1-phosphate adenylyltransferase [Candidatus Scalindua sp. SCAELEC01]TDE64219.1 MAG: glucose-1-phosphate adenylyltransferase [Candidatus Scalindua sp. AMX11]
MNHVAAIILGGGQGTRLFPLTKTRSKPAVPLGGKYRLVDIPVSNCINSGIKKIFVITQFNSESLNRSVYETYKFDHFSHGYIRILAAEQSMESKEWLQGTADAIRKNIKHVAADMNVEYFLILSGDQLYRMDYDQIIIRHQESQADVTIALTVVDKEKAPEFGLARVDDTGDIQAFIEKPKDPSLIETYYIPPSVKESEGLDANKDYVLANMGIYVFSKAYLCSLMENTDEHDFGKHIIPSLLGKKKLTGFFHNAYWEDIGTIRAFYEANLDLTSTSPHFSLFDIEQPIYAQPLFLPPSRLEQCNINNSLISEGCIAHNVTINGSVIGVRSIINEGSTINKSIIMGADFYEKRATEKRERIPMGIGKNCIIERAIIDKNACIGNNVHIINQKSVDNLIGNGYWIRDGVVVIEKGAVIPDGTAI